MMRPAGYRIAREAARQARVAAVTPAEQAAPATGEVWVQAGALDAATDAWVPFGRLDVTLLADFRLA